MAGVASPEPEWYEVIDLLVLCLTDPVGHSARQSGESGLKIRSIFKSCSRTSRKRKLMLFTWRLLACGLAALYVPAR